MCDGVASFNDSLSTMAPDVNGDYVFGSDVAAAARHMYAHQRTICHRLIGITQRRTLRPSAEGDVLPFWFQLRVICTNVTGRTRDDASTLHLISNEALSYASFADNENVLLRYFGRVPHVPTQLPSRLSVFLMFPFGGKIPETADGESTRVLTYDIAEVSGHFL